MPDESTTKAAIEQLILDNWVTTDIAFDNVNYAQTQGQEFIKPVVMFSDADNINIGATNYKRVRNTGQIVIKIYTSLDSGSLRAYTLSDDLKLLLCNRYVGNNIITYAGSTRKDGAGIDGFYSVILTIDFDSDDC